ncbi:ABC transporter substrate-binding protein [Streptomyces hesseae]|uniref:ABC transporter substrate-binding protein n=1 Tax=Streptomyces hesseae TaxID=3075519 RepID=A0ABU2SFK7_9ACTN|nr:ABC transporter substrate-binding protein [Streptomyces sp. DSM 40473]MDT0447767.1 ABC transporter substrate-binding protein [Streptomyces sp. DSM 40473]
MDRMPALGGVEDLVSVLDTLVGRPVGKREVPALVFEDDAGLGTDFVTAYRARLRDATGAGLVPHAMADDALLAQAEGADEPDVVLLDGLAAQLEQTMPEGAGGMSLTTYWMCRKILDINVGGGSSAAQRNALAEALCAAWQSDTPGLKGLRSFIDTGGAGQISARLGGIATVLVAWPLEWGYRVWLNRTRRLRWYAPKVRNAGRSATSFLAAATHLSLNGALRHNTALRQSLLLEALGTDLVRACRRGVLFPRRRRRVWPVVVLLPHIGSPGTPVRRLLDGFVKLRRRGLPLLVLAARTPDSPPADGPDRPERARALAPDQAAAALRPLRERRPRPAQAGHDDGQVVVALAGPAQSSVGDWLDTNVAVRPRRVPWPSAYLGTILAVALVAGAVPVVTWIRQDACHDTWAAGGVNVGIDTASAGCYFTGGGSQELLRTLQDRIRSQNAAAQRGGAYRTVVFLAPLTADPAGRGEQLTPAGVLQLQGAADAQRVFNEQVGVNAERPRLRLLIANVGYAYAQATGVVDRLNTLANDDTSISAVIGISQSRQTSVDAINRLSPDLPVIGAGVTGDFMTAEAPTYFQTQPANRHLARAMAHRVTDLKRKKALVLYDDKDRYSTNLKHDLDAELTGRGIAVEEPSFAVMREADQGQRGAVSTLPDLAKEICTLSRNDGIALYAARGSQLPKILNEVQGQCGAADKPPFPLLASDTDTLVEYPEIPEFAHLERYSAVELSYIAFSPDHHSDHAVGSDAFRAAAAAVYRVWTGTSTTRASNVLQQLRSDVDVRDTVATDRPFHLPADDQSLAHRPLFLCTVPHSPGTPPACRTADATPSG